MKKAILQAFILLTCLASGALAQELATISPTTAYVNSASFNMTLTGKFPVINNAVYGVVFETPGGNYINLAVVSNDGTNIVATVDADCLTQAGMGGVYVSRTINDVETDSQALPFTIVVPPPPVTAISSLYPSSAPLGAAAFTLTVNGTTFLAQDIVIWNGTPLATTYTSATQLSASVPANLLTTIGTRQISVSNGAQIVTNSLPFQVTTLQPSLTSLSPPSAIQNGAAFTLTVTGAGFVGPADCQVNNCTPSSVIFGSTALQTTFVSRTQLTAVVPAALLTATGSIPVTVANDTLVSTSVPFVVFAPVLSALTPSSVLAGGPAFTLTATGTGFQQTSTLTWAGTALATTFVSATQLTALVPAALIVAAGTASVSVPTQAANGIAASNSLPFVITPVPVITSLSPGAVAVGSAQLTLTVTGSGYLNTSVVQLNGTALATTYVSASTLTAVVPQTALATAAAGSVVVANPAAAAPILSNAATFTVVSTPVITSLSPNTASAGAATLTIAVTGTGFYNNSVISFNNTALATTFVSSTQLSASVTAGLLQTVGAPSVQVANPLTVGSLVSNSVTFTIAPPVTLTSISPSSITAGSSGVSITATGAGFTAGTTLFYNSSSLATTFVGPTQLTATIPAALLTAPGSGSITVSNAATTSNAVSFTVNLPPPPSLTLSTPSSVGPAQQPTIGFTLNSGYPIPLNGTATLTFAPNAAIPDDDPAIQFATGGRTLTFTVPANSTTLPVLSIQTGTVAGTITIAITLSAAGTDVTPPASTTTIVIGRGAPVITSATLVRGASSVTLNVVGYATSREVTQATFQFTPTAGSTFPTSNITVPLSAPFATWFGSASGLSFGSQFTLSQPFTIGGNSSSVASVTVTLQNSVGSSQPATAK